MYERNETLVSEEVQQPEQTPPAKNPPANSLRPATPPVIPVNLSAGMLENNRMKRPKRAIDILVSVVGHGLVLAVAILIPLFFSNAIDVHQLQSIYLVSPPPPPPPPPAPAPVHVIPRPKAFLSSNELYAPRVIPKNIAIVKDLNPAPQPASPGGVVGGVIGGVPGGQLGGVLGGILGGGPHIAPPPPPKAIAQHGPYRVGGEVRPPQLVREIQPNYPPLARQTQTQGDVVINCIIDSQGNVTQMKLVSGPPLLVQAAMQAVGEWKYRPTLLNGTPVAVEMHVTVHFSLGS
jgi:protein TonB